MIVKVTVSVAGHHFSHHPGEIVDMPDEFAKDWLKRGHAEKLETATAEPDKKTATRKAPKKRVVKK